MTRKFKVRSPNEDSWNDIPVDLDLFVASKEFGNEVFGWYEGIYISILKETKDVFKEGN
jgi:hypothetical protein